MPSIILPRRVERNSRILANRRCDMVNDPIRLANGRLNATDSWKNVSLTRSGMQFASNPVCPQAKRGIIQGGATRSPCKPYIAAVELLNKSSAAGGEDIRYPGIGLTFLIWNVIGVLTSARYQFGFGPSIFREDFLAATLACMAMYYPWVLLTPFVFRLEGRFPLGPGRWRQHLALLFLIGVPVCVAVSPLMVTAFFAPIRLLGGSVRGPMRPFLSFSHFPVAFICFWSSVAVGYVIRTVYQLHQQEQRAARLALEKSQLEASLNLAQLEVLRARLNPHFLFNSLQNISVLTKRDPDVASRMLTVLGDLLRAVLRRDANPESTLAEEIELTRSYVALERMRFGDLLTVTFSVQEGVEQALVPCFLMQPLLENAIIHGLRGVRKTGLIAVRVAEKDAKLVISVTDNGNGPPPDTAGMKIGVGLGSTCERLARMYPEQHQFSIQGLTGGGTEVTITLPLYFANSVRDTRAHEEIPAINRR
jgi:two-component system, LytTR family, sensor kinase